MRFLEGLSSIIRGISCTAGLTVLTLLSTTKLVPALFLPGHHTGRSETGRCVAEPETLRLFRSALEAVWTPRRSRPIATVPTEADWLRVWQ
jgi:hypothetical protein